MFKIARIVRIIFLSDKIGFCLLNHKVMKNLILIVILLFSGVSFAQQDWAPIGAKWWFKSDCLLDPDCGYYTLESKRDTLINNVWAKVIEKKIFGGEGGTNIGLSKFIMYANDNKVYNYDEINGEFYVLYDFNLQAGDTLTIQSPHKYRGFQNPYGENDIVFFQVVVDSTIIKSVGGYPLKHLYTSPTDTSAYFFNGAIKERLGNSFSIFGEPTLGMPGGYPSYLRCYKDDLIDLTNSNCDYISTTGIAEAVENTISVYPNVVNDFLQINWGKEGLAYKFTINLYDSRGEIVYTKNIVSSESILKIDTQHLFSGLYFLNVIQSTGQIYNYKIIKN